MNVLIICIGSAGDVHPFMGIGEALARRGHHVTFMVNGAFESLIRRVGFSYIPLGTAEEFHRAAENPDLWEPRKGFRVVMETGVLPSLRPVYEAVAEFHRQDPGVVVASPLAFGARIAQEKLGVRLVTVHLQPCVFRSVHRFPALGGMNVPRWYPRWGKRFLYWLMDRGFIDPVLVPEINRFRAELELPPIRRPLDGWWHSPQAVLTLVPDWFADPQPDWPSQNVCVGFPLYDEGDLSPPPDLADYLGAGPPPVVFTPGSAMRHGQAFFETAVRACELAGLRGLLLTRHTQQLPSPLPDHVRHYDYIPFSRVLPRAAALVHHGGIGTSAQGLRAGVPQVVMPMAHDQPDNAVRLCKMGVARALPPSRFRPERLARILQDLTRCDRTKQHCGKIAGRLAAVDAISPACDLIEQVGSRSQS